MSLGTHRAKSQTEKQEGGPNAEGKEQMQKRSRRANRK